MKKLIIPLLLLCLILTSCAIKSEDYELLQKAVDNTNKNKKYEASFYFSMTSLIDDTTLMFSQGEVSCDKTGELKMNGTMKQYIMGSSSSSVIAFNNGMYYNSTDDSKVKFDMEEEQLLSQFLCADAFIFDKELLKSASREGNGSKEIYSFKSKPDSEKLSKLLGDDIYTLTGVLNPDRSLTKYSEVKCTYTLDYSSGEAVLSGVSFQFSVEMYNQIPYVPNGKVDKDDYKSEVLVNLRTSYLNFGDSVSVELPDDSEYEHLDDILDDDGSKNPPKDDETDNSSNNESSEPEVSEDE